MTPEQLKNMALVVERGEHIEQRLKALRQVLDVMRDPNKIVTEVTLEVGFKHRTLPPKQRYGYSKPPTTSVSFDGEQFDVTTGLRLLADLEKQLLTELASLTPETDLLTAHKQAQSDKPVKKRSKDEDDEEDDEEDDLDDVVEEEIIEEDGDEEDEDEEDEDEEEHAFEDFEEDEE